MLNKLQKIDSSLEVVSSDDANKITGRSDGLSATEFTALVLNLL